MTMPVATPKTTSASKNVLTIALAGNPNSGKTTLFNALTRLRQKVGNYPGVTVEKKVGRLDLDPGRAAQVIDLPGTYSLSVRSPDEKIARDVLLGRISGTPMPDVVVCVVDASNLERNLYLVVQIMDIGLPVVVALNMMDEAEAQERTIDVKKLSEGLQCPVVPMVANKNIGIDTLKKVLKERVDPAYRRQWRMAPVMEEVLSRLVQCLKDEGLNAHEAFHCALSLLNVGLGLEHLEDIIGLDPARLHVQKTIDELKKTVEGFGLRGRSAAIEARYAWIKSIVRTSVQDRQGLRENLTQRIDRFVLHKFWGWIVFLGMMAFMFYTIFAIATYPMDWIDQGFSQFSGFLARYMPEGLLKDLMIDGVIAGVGGVVIFLPQILTLFFFIGLLQDTGYMARAAFIMDRVMSKVGLHGKSFIPLLSSFACAIPGIMAARTIESPKDRFVTILVAPLMSCSARLPVYAVMIAVLMPVASAWQKAGIMLIMYLLGIIGACVMAWFFKKTLFKSQAPTFILELPPYRWPSLKTVLLHMWERSRLFLKRAGTIILAMSIVLWALMSFPKIETVDPTQQLQQSIAGQMGKTLEPLIEPLGFDWRIGIGLVGSFAAREVFVSTMSIVFNLGEDSDQFVLRDAFSNAQWPDGRPLFTPLVCLSLLVFYVFALQCLSTVSVVWRELNSWKWALFQWAYMAVLAYGAAFLVYQGGRLLGLQ